MKVTDKKLNLQQNILYNTIGMTINLGCQWLITVLAVRLSSDFTNSGLLTLAMSVTNIFYAIASFSLRTYQVSDINNKYKDTIYVQVRAFTAGLAFLLCGIYSIVLYRDERFWGIMLYMIFRVIEAFVDILQGFEQRVMRMDLAGKSMAVRGIGNVIVFAAIIVLTDSFNLAVLGMVIVSAVVMLVYDIRYSSQIAQLSGKIEPATVKDIFMECLPMGIASALNTSIISIPRTLLDMIDGQEVLGIYGALAVPTVIVQVAATYVFNPMLPVYATHYTEKNKKEFFGLFNKTMIVIVVLSIIALGGSALLQDLLLPILLGESIRPYIYMFIPMMICTILNAVVWFQTSLLVVIRDFNSYLWGTVAAAIVTVFIGYPMIEKFSMQGVNYTLYVVMVLQVIVFGVVLAMRFRKNFDKES